jgi:hypothetical protein
MCWECNRGRTENKALSVAAKERKQKKKTEPLQTALL